MKPTWAGGASKSLSASNDPKNSTHQAPTLARAPDAANAAPIYGGSTTNQLPSSPWGKSAPGAFSPSSNGPAGWTPGKPSFRGSSGWTPRKATPAPFSNTENGARADSITPPAKSTSNLGTAIWDQGHNTGSKNAVSRPLSGSRNSDPILDTIFTKPPIRKPPPNAEFPQLKRKGSKEDMFEVMSPFKLPSRQQWSKNKTAPPGPAKKAITRDLPSRKSHSIDRGDGQLPRRDRYPDWGASRESESFTRATRPSYRASQREASHSSKESRTGDQFELMSKTAVTEQQGMNSSAQDDWDGGSTTPSYTPRDKGNKRRKYGGDRRQNIDEDDYFEDYDIDELQESKAKRKQRQRRLDEQRAAEEAAAPKTIRLPEYITVYDLAEALRIKPAQFLHDLEQLGFENTLHDSVMTGETAALVAAEYGFEPTVESGEKVDLRPRPPPEDPSSVPPRPPIVTIMGHVDHGKTTILDTLRKSSIVAQEFGGITQHIGAFSVKLSMGKTITFLDTPGHAAFLSMRQRGANVTDIVVLVVAVDDSVKPQTIEAIKHAQSAKVPMIVAINKIDVDNTPHRIDMVKQDLANNGVELEDYGGDVQVVAMSGKTGRGIKDLEDAILTLSEVLDMRAETDGMAEGWVLEASIKPDGRAATILVKRGTLRIGDLIAAGTAYTKVRIMRNEAGVDVEEAGPGTPIEIYGSWKGEPMAGDMVLQAPDETKAQAAVDYRQEIAERAIAAAQNAEREAQDREKAEREVLKRKIEEAETTDDPELVEVGPKLVSLIVKGDVMGSVEAVSMAIQEIGNNEVRPRILRASPGQITESDVDHMATAKGAIVNFNTATPGHVLQRANNAGVVILDHNIIYETVQAVKDLLSAQLEPIYTQRVIAEAQVQKIFPINITKRKYKNIAGVKVTNGKVTRGGQYRVMRDGEEVYKGKLTALKQNKDDVTEVRKGIECGMMFDEYDDFQEGDLIQLYEDVEQPRYL
ncbi:translation initiation factor IF-2 [Gnomoniopsis sp. IMI 355080]|nr:translation initiation factor IF-2 [Gnomoniopsis sp. IMI 355080]